MSFLSSTTTTMSDKKKKTEKCKCESRLYQSKRHIQQSEQVFWGLDVSIFQIALGNHRHTECDKSYDRIVQLNIIHDWAWTIFLFLKSNDN